MKTVVRLGLAVLSGVLLGLAWTGPFAVVLIFIAFIPLFWLFSDLEKTPDVKNGKRFFGYSFLTFLVWNIITTWWVFNSTPAAIFAFLSNSVWMALMVYLYYIVKKHVFKGRNCLWVLMVFFTAFEYFHFDWDLSWPWITLGNVFAWQPSLVQFYEFTGALGGSIWIWASNIALFGMFRQRIYQQLFEHLTPKTRFAKALPRMSRLWAGVVLCVPMLVSLVMYSRYEEKGTNMEVLVVQPNIDPYSEQYDLDPVVATERLLRLAETKISPNTRLILTPESMIQEYVWEHKMAQSPSLRTIQAFLSKYDSVEMIAGLSSFHLVPEQTAAARSYGNQFYEAHNTALLVSKDDYSQKYYKSKLTPGVEIMPFVKYFRPLEKLALDMGGTVGTLGISVNRDVFRSQYGTPPFSPVICYESIYGDFVSGFVRNGAQFLCIITNDGWWGNSPGHRQHARYARLRAIETRRDIARCANTGISCFINQRGDVFQATPYWEEAVISQTIKANDEITFYVKYGDYIGRISLFFAGLLLLLAIVFRWMMPIPTK
ncbi:MAG: apolipoprotein N-acyltransferase [Bacteroidales bacterium]|jgi:apolipoprotein N-acyltransferase|nr:apolipoprotein N-acyltransferase [Bacteroidales bacterium]